MRKIVWKQYETAKERHHSVFEKLDDGDTYLRAQVDRVMEEDQAILAALAGTEKKPEGETEDD
jgi:acyl dehydratase